MDIVTCYNC